MRLQEEEYFFNTIKFPTHPRLHSFLGVVFGCILMIVDSWPTFSHVEGATIEFNFLYVWPFVLIAIIIDNKISFRSTCEKLRNIHDVNIDKHLKYVATTMLQSCLGRTIRIISGLIIIVSSYTIMLLSVTVSMEIFKRYF